MRKTIWKIELWDKETGVTIQELYFLFCHSAKKWLKANELAIQDQGLSYIMGGETLWFRFKNKKFFKKDLTND